MHAEKTPQQDSDTLTHTQSATSDEAPLDTPQPLHSIMNVLRPARPPEPKNARIIRRFDLEGAIADPHPAAADSAPAAHFAKSVERKSRNREEARAQRNKSLFAAAKLGDFRFSGD